jgi:hypothetical protein
VGDILVLEQLPDQGVVDFAKAVMGSSDSGYGPGEC